MDEADLSFNEALASLIIGRGAAAALMRESSSQSDSGRLNDDAFECAYPSTALAAGILELKALISLAGGSQGHEMLGASRVSKSSEAASSARATLTPGRTIAAVAILLESQAITAANMSDMDFEEVPDTLRLLTSLTSLSLCGNGPLRSIVHVRRCGGLRAVDLSDCPALQELRPLGVLPYLEVVDLSRCTSVQDIRPLLLPERGREGSSEAVSPSTASAAYSTGFGISPTKAQPESAGPLGHPSLRWLALDGCTALRWGVDDLARCPELLYVDLFGCTQAEHSQCFAASQAPRLKTFVWPSSQVLEKVANAEGWSQAVREEAAASATASVADKVALARGHRPSTLPRLPAVSGNARREALASAVRAACEMGLAPGDDPADAEILLGNVPAATPAGRQRCDSESAIVSSAADKPSAHQPPPRAVPRIRPMEFARALHALGLQIPGVESCQLFRMLDVDGDGGISSEELGALAQGPATEVEVRSAISVLLLRHGGACDATAADLAGGRAALDLSRIRECLIVAGIDEAVARRVAVSLAHCASGLIMQFVGTDVEAALVHALGGYAVARAAELTEDFRAHLRGRFQRCEDAFSVLDVNRIGAVSWEEFQRRLRDALRWPQASVPGAGEAIFRVLDMEGNGFLSAKAFPSLENFEASATIQAMITAGRALSSGPVKNLPDSLRELDPVDMGVWSRAFTRPEFVSAWQELERENVFDADVDARIVFGLLDLNGNNCLGREEIAWLVDALPRQAEAAAAGALQVALVTRYGTLEDAHSRLVSSRQQLAPLTGL